MRSTRTSSSLSTCSVDHFTPLPNSSSWNVWSVIFIGVQHGEAPLHRGGYFRYSVKSTMPDALYAVAKLLNSAAFVSCSGQAAPLECAYNRRLSQRTRMQYWRCIRSCLTRSLHLAPLQDCKASLSNDAPASNVWLLKTELFGPCHIAEQIIFVKNSNQTHYLLL